MITRLARRLLRTIDARRAARRVQGLAREEPRGIAAGFGPLAGADAQLERLRDEYREAHRRYVAAGTDPGMAVSLEQIALLAFLVRALPVTRVCDTGSGLSSYVLRKEAERKGGIVHYAVDDNAAWLDRTRELLRAAGLSDERVVSLEAFRADPAIGDFDLVFHDMGDPTTRIITLPLVAERVGRDGWLVLDDMHKELYHPHAVHHLRPAWITQSVVRLTLDRYGRFAYVCRRKPGAS